MQLKCPDCGESASVEVVNGGWRILCPNGHKNGLRLGRMMQGFDPLILNMPERSLERVLSDEGVPSCFGGRITRRYRSALNDCTDLPVADHPLDALTKLIDDESGKAQESGRQLAKCAKCQYFDRCVVIGGQR